MYHVILVLSNQINRHVSRDIGSIQSDNRHVSCDNSSAQLDAVLARGSSTVESNR